MDLVMKENEFLSNAPLKEVIFELHWELDYIPEQKMQIDTGFEAAALNFNSSCQQGFKVVEMLKPSSIPSTAFIHEVTHRFYKEKGQYPLYQLGPGVFTVNDNNKNYKWDDFSKLILNGVNCLKNSYTKPLILSKIELRYIDAVPLNILGKTNKFDFLKKHLKVNAEGYEFVNGTLEDINFTKRFSVSNDSFLNMIIATAFENETKQEGVIWQTFINNKKRISWEELSSWIESAHEIASTTFKNMISDELYNHFA
jgi:uncharacterized protein (TIGR04255 family)